MKKIFIFLVMTLFAVSTLTAQNTAKIQSIFIYNFIKLIEWPASYRTGNFNIAVLGNDAIYDELSALAQAKKAGNQTIVVKKINSLGELSNPHILYVPKSQSGQIENAKAAIGKKSVLLISDDGDGTSKGADINFIIVDNKPKFEISPAGAQAKSLQVSSNLINLGIKK